MEAISRLRPFGLATFAALAVGLAAVAGFVYAVSSTLIPQGADRHGEGASTSARDPRQGTVAQAEFVILGRNSVLIWDATDQQTRAEIQAEYMPDALERPHHGELLVLDSLLGADGTDRLRVLDAVTSNELWAVDIPWRRALAKAVYRPTAVMSADESWLYVGVVRARREAPECPQRPGQSPAALCDEGAVIAVDLEARRTLRPTVFPQRGCATPILTPTGTSGITAVCGFEPTLYWIEGGEIIGERPLTGTAIEHDTGLREIPHLNFPVENGDGALV